MTHDLMYKLHSNSSWLAIVVSNLMGNMRSFVLTSIAIAIMPYMYMYVVTTYAGNGWVLSC